ncbi:hypothetical protein HZB94_02770 [Candidatus Falkowbacteria bacterium]|nr:hypothetical protein [Candidatus Falkowbacteria bacterium]
MVIFLMAWYDFVVALTIAIGGFFTLYFPGLNVSFMFFPETRSFARDGQSDFKITSLDSMERQIFSLFLSICVVVLSLVILRFLKIELSATRVIIIIAIINILTIIGNIFSYKLKIKSN